MINIDNYKLGVTQELLQIDSFDGNRIVTAAMAQQCQRTLDIVSRLLDPPVFNTPDFIEAVKRFATKNRKPRIRIIVFDPETIVKNGHRLVDLAGRLSSFIEIRKSGNDYKDYNECLLLADETAFLHRINAERYEATANFNDRRQSKYYLKQFDTMWDVATPDPNLRRVNL